jgi:hypothetical protein
MHGLIHGFAIPRYAFFTFSFCCSAFAARLELPLAILADRGADARLREFRIYLHLALDGPSRHPSTTAAAKPRRAGR